LNVLEKITNRGPRTFPRKVPLTSKETIIIMTLTYKNRRITRPFRLARFGDDGENL
jgi:hypothetical protein